MGIRPLMEAIESGKSIDKVLIQKGNRGELFAEMMNLIKLHKIGFNTVPLEKLNRITRKNHQGIIAFLSPIEFSNLDDVIMNLFESGKSPKILMLDRISDVRNFGAICRSAECFGFHAVVVPFKGAAQISEDAVKTSAGALLRIPVCKANNLTYSANFLKTSGVKVIGISEKADTHLRDSRIDGPFCLVMGSEEDGITPELLDTCDDSLKINMQGEIASLNVSVSAAIAMYELNKMNLTS